MPRITITAQVQVAANWSIELRTYGALFNDNSASATCLTMTVNNEAVILREIADAGKYMEHLDAPETADAATGSARQL